MEFLISWIIDKLRGGHPKSENARHAKRSWKKRGQKTLSSSKAILCLTLAFLYIPLFVIIVFSFIWRSLAVSFILWNSSHCLCNYCNSFGNPGRNRNQLVQFYWPQLHKIYQFPANGFTRSNHGSFTFNFLKWNPHEPRTGHNYNCTCNLLSSFCISYG